MRCLKIISLTLLLLCFSALGAVAAEDTLNLKVDSKLSDNENFTYSFEVWKSHNLEDETYYLALPAFLKDQKLNISCNGSIVIDGKQVNGAISLAEGIHTVSLKGKEYALQVMYESKIPAIYIDTDSGSMDNVHRDKSNKEPGNITVMYNDEVVYSGKLDYIKGRGNSTWEMPKKPYNIKLEDKISFLVWKRTKAGVYWQIMKI